MKLIVFAPAITSSAIGRMTSLVTRELVSLGHDVAVIRTESEQILANATHDFNADLIPWNEMQAVRDLLEQADAYIYQIGDNYEFHQGALQWLPHFPGLICLHDFYVGHLFYGWAQTNRAQAQGILRAWYGNDAAARFFNYLTSEMFIEETCHASPMTEWICSMADGVITHSSWDIERVLRSCSGPVHVVPLPYNTAETEIAGDTTGRSVADRFRLLTIGHVNKNKRVASVIQAIGNSSLLRERTSYRLAGYVKPEDAHALTALAYDCGVDLIISGQVDDEELASAIREADVISCLRWPTLEAASASAIEAMLYGKPIIVTDAGFFSEVPDTCAFKIDPHDEIGSIQSALERLLQDESHRFALGETARTWAVQTFNAENYAKSILEMIVLTHKAKPVLSAVDRILSIAHDWGGSPDLLALPDTVRPLRIFGASSELPPDPPWSTSGKRYRKETCEILVETCAKEG
jgi:glycosyltransferase involved in cell wall biosynthesis